VTSRTLLHLWLAALVCATTPVAGAAQTPPFGWTIVAPPREEEGWLCANWTRELWHIQLGESDANIRIVPASRRPEHISLSFPHGRLVGTDHGEFGGALEWEPAGTSRKVVVLKGNPVAFVSSTHGVFLAEGLAHGGMRRGQLLELLPASATWIAQRVIDFRDAPLAVALVGPATLLVRTTESMMEVDLRKRVATTLFTNPRWSYVHGRSGARLSSGGILAGIPRGVIVLRPAPTGFVEEWWVPSSCVRLRKTSEVATCECVPD
jgi:hypothetical protein